MRLPLDEVKAEAERLKFTNLHKVGVNSNDKVLVIDDEGRPS